MKLIRKIKDAMYYCLVESNPTIRFAYQTAINANPEYHKKHRVRSWIRLIGLNIKHRIFRVKPNHETHEKKDKPAPPVANKKPAQAPANPTPANPIACIGSESARYSKPSVENWISTLLGYDIISFDVFDTLVFRPLSAPSQVFMLLGDQLGIANFKELRVRAEREAREIKQEQEGTREVGLEEIYHRLRYYIDLDMESCIRAEVDLEFKLCHANPYMKRLFDILKANGKKFIAISDMYLSTQAVTELLARCGYKGFDAIYVSSDCGCSKATGELFEYVDKELRRDADAAAEAGLNLLHIDDNWHIILKARDFGWNAHHYPNVNYLGNSHRTPDLSPLIGSAFGGVVNAYLHNGIKQYTPHYEFGFIYGGLFVLGYCQWLYAYCLDHHIEKLLFFSRDGDIFKKVFDSLFDDVATEYVYYSRIVGARLSVRTWRYFFLESFVLRWADNPMKITLLENLQQMDLAFLARYLPNYGLSHQDILDSKNPAKLNAYVDMLQAHWGEIVEANRNMLEAGKVYLGGLVKGHKKVATVDVGWRGTSGYTLEKFVKEECAMDCEFVTLMAASLYEMNTTQMMTGNMAAYLFSPFHNQKIYFTHERFRVDNYIYEFFLSATHSTIEKYHLDEAGKLKFTFGLPEIENYDTIRNIQEGILDFVAEYGRHWKDNAMMMRISGGDVAMNIQHLAKHKDYFYKYFGEYYFNPSIGGQIISFRHILDKYF